MSIDEQIAVLQAYKEGKTITCMVKDTGSFFEVNIKKNGADYIFDFVEYEFSINPEPREFWIVKSTGLVKRICMSEEEALRFCEEYRRLKPGVEIIHVCEVTGE